MHSVQSVSNHHNNEQQLPYTAEISTSAASALTPLPRLSFANRCALRLGLALIRWSKRSRLAIANEASSNRARQAMRLEQEAVNRTRAYELERRTL
ncbi:hypothetical protein [Humidisolicoccus flavus]|uniref:hypothetical protein n=1 Tax=Humidisolicoccus flavus TaxID=3111414 RepID=UPI003253D8F1